MEDLISNLETDIVAGSYDIFNKVLFLFIQERFDYSQALTEFVGL